MLDLFSQQDSLPVPEFDGLDGFGYVTELAVPALDVPPKEFELFSPEIPLDLLDDDTLCFTEFLGESTDGSSRTSPLSKRKSASGTISSQKQKRHKLQLNDLRSDLDCALFSEFSECGLDTLPSGSPCDLSVPDNLVSEITSGRQNEEHREASVDSSGDSAAFTSEAAAQFSEPERTAEYHFQQIQKHARLAVAALKRGQYERTKNIVTWAHDLKNKVAHEVS